MCEEKQAQTLEFDIYIYVQATTTIQQPEIRSIAAIPYAKHKTEGL